MKKLKLRIEVLSVESFSTHQVEALPGTVLAHNSGDSCNTMNAFTCQYYATCGGGGSCNGVDSCNHLCIPQEKQAWIGVQADPTPCCTAGC